MEFRAGQVIHVGVDTSGVIYNVNESQVTVLNWDRRTKIFRLEYLNAVIEVKDYASISDEVEDNMREIYEEAMKYNELIITYLPMLKEA